MKRKQLLVFLTLFVGLNQLVAQDPRVVIQAPLSPTLYRNMDNLVVFQVHTYNAALDDYTKRTICNVNVTTPDCDSYDACSVSKSHVCTVSPVVFEQRVGYNEAYVIINTGYTEPTANYRVRFRNIRLKNSAASCAASSQSIPNQVINFRIIRTPWSYDDCIWISRTANEELPVDKFGKKPRLAVADLLLENSEAPISFPTGTVRLENDGQNGVNVVKKPILNLDENLSAKVMTQTAGVRLLVYAKESRNAEVQVVDLSGRTVYQQNELLNNGLTQTQLDVDLNAGVYLIRINDGANQTVVKFVKM